MQIYFELTRIIQQVFFSRGWKSLMCRGNARKH